jgi:hypothetical protein
MVSAALDASKLPIPAMRPCADGDVALPDAVVIDDGSVLEHEVVEVRQEAGAP